MGTYYKVNMGDYEIITDGSDGGGKPDWTDYLLYWILRLILIGIIALFVWCFYNMYSTGRYGVYAKWGDTRGGYGWKYSGEGLESGQMWIDEQMKDDEYYMKPKP